MWVCFLCVFFFTSVVCLFQTSPPLLLNDVSAPPAEVNEE